MSLRYHLDKIDDWQDLTNDDGSMKPLTEHLVFATMHVGIGEITEKDAAEFYARLKIAYATGLSAPSVFNVDQGKWEDRPVTRHDIVRHIGLATNVAYESRPAWLKRWVGGEMRELYREFSRRTPTESAVQ